MATTTEQEMSVEQFESLMNMIQSHTSTTLGMINAGLSGPVPAIEFPGVPEDLARALGDDVDAAEEGARLSRAALTSGVKAILDNHKTRTVKQLDTQKAKTQSTASAHVKKVKAGGNVDQAQKDFEAAINSQKDENIRAYTKNENELAKQLIAEGNANPASRPAIITAYAKVSQFISNLVNQIKAALIKLVSQIIRLLERAVRAIVDTFTSLVTGAVSFFGSLF